MLPHTLEFVDNPRQLLSEACRIIKPEGLIAISGFNPVSPWGFRKLITRNNKQMPWGANFIHAQKIKNWLRLSDFAMEKHEYTLFTLPINHPGLHKKLHFLEKLRIPVLGGAYVLIARAKVIPLTPIRMKWKQQLSSIRITGTIPGHIARRSK
jgi:SAM-dependent methyltransferase